MERLASGDPHSPRELVERYHPDLHRYARALLRDETAAEDAVQEAFAKAFGALGKYQPDRIESLNVRPWLYRITLNVVRNSWRANHREISMPALPETSAHNSAPPNPGSRLDRESWLDVLAALEHLSEKQRIAVTLRYLEDLPFAEVAEATGWPENTCKTLVRRGIARLSALLAVGLDGREVS